MYFVNYTHRRCGEASPGTGSLGAEPENGEAKMLRSENRTAGGRPQQLPVLELLGYVAGGSVVYRPEERR